MQIYPYINIQMKTLLNYSIITLTHKATPLKDIGQFVLAASDATNDDNHLPAQLRRVQAENGIEELLYLATCNRILYVLFHESPIDEAWVQSFLKTTYAHLSAETLQIGGDTVQFYQGVDAITHLFEVASSIDSLVVGEREILRQLRTAYDTQVQYGTTGDAIRLAMRFTVEAAKKVYSNTAIGEKPVSIVSLAMQKLYAHHIAPEARYLIVGAGQTNQLVGKFLLKHNLQNLAVFNRTLAKAEELAQSICPTGKGYTLKDLQTYDKGFDVLIVCTSATEPIITPDLYKNLLKGDMANKVIVDLSIPHNVSEAVVKEFDIDYIEIEKLKILAKENLSFREREVTNAKALLSEEVATFEKAFRARQVELALSDVPKQIKAVTDHAVNNLFSHNVAQLDEQSRAVLDKVVTYLERRCIAIPLQVAKENLVGKF